MKETLISFKTAQLAKEKEFDLKVERKWSPNNRYQLDFVEESNDTHSLHVDRDHGMYSIQIKNWNKQENVYSAPTQSLLQKFIRETRGVHIEIHRNASGYYWSMCMTDGGTDLGWSEYAGPNDGGVWNTFEEALENALQVQLSYDLPEDKTIIKHWGNYVNFVFKSIKDNDKKNKK